MNHQKFTQQLRLAILASSLWVVHTYAAETFPAGWTLTPMIGYHGHSADKQNLEDSQTLSIAAGYQWQSPWAIELAYLTSRPDLHNFKQAVDEDQLRLDALYYFDKAGKLRPFAVMGAGQSAFELGGDKDKSSVVNAGLGVKYALNEVVALRSDLRAVNYLDTETTQAAFNLGVNFLLGGKGSKAIEVKDSDRDGVSDNLDSCPGTQADAHVDANGCPIKNTKVKDNDGDGVADAKDQCPDTQAGAKVDAKGCYLTLSEEKTVTLGLTFANNAAEVMNPNDAQLVALANFLTEYPNTDVTLNGYTDSRGSEAYNKVLSEKRAAAVATILQTRYTINRARIKAQGFGEANPVADNDSAEGRAQNRRVEARVSTTVERVVK